jgi:UPF0716 family protein affecting phage T7 exclusion
MRVRFLSLTLVFLLLIPQVVAAQSQAVSPSELQKAMSEAARNRQKNRDDVQAFFCSEPVRHALKTGKVDYQRVQKAVMTLSPDELARLASRTNQLQRDFAAGALTNQELTYIVIALAAAVIVLIAVKA